MYKHDVIVIGASAGGVEALKELVAGLPPDLPAAVFVVLHIARHGTSFLPEILSREGALPACFPRSGQRIEPGSIYIAPNNQHLLIKPGYMILSRGPRENGFRPGIDALFRTAADTYGARVVGVQLTGLLDNGCAGLVVIKRHGGKVIIQDPADAAFPSMPQNALQVVSPDYILPLNQIPAQLIQFAADDVEPSATPANHEHPDIAQTGETHHLYHNSDDKRFELVCPDCGGGLVEHRSGKDNHLISYMCRVGHTFSLHSLQAEQAHATEAALWAAIRSLEENHEVSRRMMDYARQINDLRMFDTYQDKAQKSELHADAIRRILLGGS